MPNALSASPENCGNAIASGHNAVRRQDCESAHLAAARRDERELHVVLADEADRQKRSWDAKLRENFIITGISNLSTSATNLCSSCSGNSPCVMRDREVLSAKASGLRTSRAVVLNYEWFANAEKNLKMSSEENRSLKTSCLSTSKRLPTICQQRAVQLHVFGAG